MPPGPERPLFGKASKKPLNSEQVLVSRKAMQNYNRSLDCANIFTTFFQKKAFFLRFAWFRTPEGRFRIAASAPAARFFQRGGRRFPLLWYSNAPDPREGKGKPTGGNATGGEERHQTEEKATGGEAHAQPAGGLRAT